MPKNTFERSRFWNQAKECSVYYYLVHFGSWQAFQLVCFTGLALTVQKKVREVAHKSAEMLSTLSIPNDVVFSIVFFDTMSVVYV